MDVKDKPKYKETGWQFSVTGMVTLVAAVVADTVGEKYGFHIDPELIATTLVPIVTGMAYRAVRHQQVEKAPAKEEVGEDEDRKGDI